MSNVIYEDRSMKITIGESVKFSPGALHAGKWCESIKDSLGIIMDDNITIPSQSKPETRLPYQYDTIGVSLFLTVYPVEVDKLKKALPYINKKNLRDGFFCKSTMRALSLRYAKNLAQGQLFGLNSLLSKDDIIEIKVMKDSRNIDEENGSVSFGFSTKTVSNEHGINALADLIYNAFNGTGEPLSLSLMYYGRHGFGAEYYPSFVSGTVYYASASPCHNLRSRIIAIHPDEIEAYFHSVDGRGGIHRLAEVHPLRPEVKGDFHSIVQKILNKQAVTEEDRIFVLASLVRGCDIDL